MANVEYYEENTQQRSFEVEGISGRVTNYSIVDMYYPNIQLIVKDKNPQLYKLQILRNMRVSNTSRSLSNTDEKLVMVYFKGKDTENMEVGKIYQSQVRAILKMFDGECDIIVNTEAKRKLTGKYIYAMCM